MGNFLVLSDVSVGLDLTNLAKGVQQYWEFYRCDEDNARRRTMHTVK